MGTVRISTEDRYANGVTMHRGGCGEAAAAAAEKEKGKEREADSGVG